ncbi:HAMP domain-containing histidine kinase [Fulvivirga sp. M361]|uniref:sensor histidine kinase n=1 Tax=Fulvivirga sp. M361 TaxID=2594266 RepID=UPI001179FA53|nr:HAMP domain-containing sensor histidine kinase [Fulvivirga sp. M361]TRX61302.1 HAMP domain-containing histidine kinase [Fulvivirga sp. M361]
MSSLRKIALILLLVFLLPAIFFSAYEISALSEEEKMIEETYRNQLDAILFSANQYSDDVLNNWIAKVQVGFEEHGVAGGLPSKIESLLSLHPALPVVFTGDTLNNEASVKLYHLDDPEFDIKQTRVCLRKALSTAGKRMRQLLRYQESGFQKIEPLNYDLPDCNNHVVLIFILDSPVNHKRICGMVLQPDMFIEELLGPKLQSIAKDQFVLRVYRKGSPSPTYSTFEGDQTSNSAALTKDLWVLPDYYLGIATLGVSIQQIIKDRTYTNISLIVVLDIILILGVWMVFSSVKKEVQLAQNKSDFVSNVSHEIRTPLALISMFAETLKLGRVKSEEKKQEYYSIIHKETNRLTGIVNRILTFSRVEANDKALTIQPANLNTIVQDVLNTYEFHLKNKGFQWQFTPNLKSDVLVDDQAAVEVIVNLIDNAIKYSDSVKNIEINTARKDAFGIVRIIDKGAGISRQDQKHIFEKFYRVSSGDLAKSRGTGLGLSLVKEIVENHQGRIEVVSELKKGSTFTIYFPLANQKE